VIYVQNIRWVVEPTLLTDAGLNLREPFEPYVEAVGEELSR
jgi:hypothetical protein